MWNNTRLYKLALELQFLPRQIAWIKFDLKLNNVIVSNAS